MPDHGPFRRWSRTGEGRGAGKVCCMTDSKADVISVSNYLIKIKTLSYPGGKAKYAPPLLFFLHHPKTAQGIKLKLSDFKDTLLRHILQVKPVP